MSKETFNQSNIKSVEVKSQKLLESKLKRAGEITLEIQAAGGSALIVGGFARDEIMRRLGMTGGDSKDIDVEVYGLGLDKLIPILNNFGKPDLVGESFGVIKIGDLDISIPRRDSKTGSGHKDFKIEGDPTMTPKEASQRRDLTINALALDPLSGNIIDEWGGIEDLQKKILRATDLERFGDDPLRVLRLMQFAGRFGFTIDEITEQLARTLPLDSLSKERITEEWKKLLLKSQTPSLGLEAGRRMEVIKKLHPELYALIGVPQEPKYHPEGDVWEHTLQCIDAANIIALREQINDEEKLVLMLAVLCHDLGKATTTEFVPNKKDEKAWRSYGHEEAGVEPTKNFLRGMHFTDVIKNKVYNLVAHHLFPALVRDATDSAIRRLSRRLAPANITELVRVGEADHRGRAIVWDGYPAGKELLRRAAELKVELKQPERILMGRHLIELGLKPGVQFKKILDTVYSAQLEGQIKNLAEAKDLAQKKY